MQGPAQWYKKLLLVAPEGDSVGRQSCASTDNYELGIPIGALVLGMHWNYTVRQVWSHSHTPPRVRRTGAAAGGKKCARWGVWQPGPGAPWHPRPTQRQLMTCHCQYPRPTVFQFLPPVFFLASGAGLTCFPGMLPSGVLAPARLVVWCTGSVSGQNVPPSLKHSVVTYHFSGS
jgi:hypothetical protein